MAVDELPGMVIDRLNEGEIEERPLRGNHENELLSEGGSERQRNSTCAEHKFSRQVCVRGDPKYLVLIACVALLELFLVILFIVCVAGDWDRRVRESREGSDGEIATESKYMKPIAEDTHASAGVIAFSALCQALTSMIGFSLFLWSVAKSDKVVAKSDKVSLLQRLAGWYFGVYAVSNAVASFAYTWYPTAWLQLVYGVSNTAGTIWNCYLLERRCQQLIPPECFAHLDRFLKYMKYSVRFLLAVWLYAMISSISLELLPIAAFERIRATGQLINVSAILFFGFIGWGIFWLSGACVLYYAMDMVSPAQVLRKFDDKILEDQDLDILAQSYKSARCEFMAMIFALSTWCIAFPCFSVTVMNNISPFLGDSELAALSSLLVVDTMSNDILVIYMSALGRTAEKARDALLATIRVAVKSQYLAQAKIDWEKSKQNKDLTPWAEGFDFDFIDVGKFLASGLLDGVLPKHQVLLEQGFIKTRHVTIDENGSLVGEDGISLIHDTAVMSYAWSGPDHPDPDGVLAEAVRQFLQDHPHFKWLWMDWVSLPQRERSTEDESKFKASLKNANMIYLGAGVVIVLTEDYLQRFWTQFEAFLSYQRIDKDKGLMPCGSPSPRTAIVFPSTVAMQKHKDLEAKLVEKWSKCSIYKAMSQLADKDTKVTNGSDKIKQLGKMLELRELPKMIKEAKANYQKEE